MPNVTFIWELPKKERLKYYKRIKASLIKDDAYTYTNLVECMSEKIIDLPYELI